MQEEISSYTKQQITNLLSHEKKFWTLIDDNEISLYMKQVDKYLVQKISYKYYELILLKIKMLTIKNKNRKAINFALESIKNISEDDITGIIIDIYNKIGNIYSYLSEFDTAIDYFEKSISFSQREEDDKRFIEAIINKANVYVTINKQDDAKEIYLNALEFAKKIKNKKFVVICYSNLGLVYMQKHEYHNALENYMKAMKLYEELNNQKQVYVVMANLSILYFHLENYEEAISYSLKAIEVGESLKEWNRLSQLYNNLGSIYLNHNNLQEGEKYLTKAMNLKIKIGVDYGLAKTLNNLSEILHNQKRYDKALEYLKKSLEIKRKLGDKPGEFNSLLNVTNIFTELQKYSEALETIKEVEKVADELNDIKLKPSIYELYYKFYSKKGDAEKAFYYHKKLSKVFFENYANIHDKQLNKLMTKFENEKAEKEKKLQYLKNIELKRANTTKDKFFSIIAHDLKSPFSAIVSFITLMKLGYDKFSPERIESLINELDSNVKNTYGLLENLLTWSRMQSRAMRYKPQNINVNVIINKVFTTLHSKADEKNIKLINHASTELYVYADYFMLQTVIRNLVNNAIKFTSSDGTISIFAQDIGGKIKISVKDTGVGIPKDGIDKLFKIESSFSTYGTNQEKGTGLGLILCKEFVEKNNGKISVESEVGKGTTFLIELPLLNTD